MGVLAARRTAAVLSLERHFPEQDYLLGQQLIKVAIDIYYMPEEE